MRFNSHLITIWHRDSSKQASVDGILACVLEELPAELRPKAENLLLQATLRPRRLQDAVRAAGRSRFAEARRRQ